jgi:hypothetical protein
MSWLSFFEAVFFPFVEQICFRATKVHDFGAAVAIFFLDGALLTIVGIRNTLASANDTAALITSIVALVANTNERAWAHIAVANDAFAVAFYTQPSDCNARKFSAHDQIGMMLGHSSSLQPKTH